MKKIQWVRVQYRNRFVYLFRRLLPRRIEIEYYCRGKWRKMEGVPIGVKFEIRSARRFRPLHLIDALAFVFVVRWR